MWFIRGELAAAVLKRALVDRLGVLERQVLQLVAFDGLLNLIIFCWFTSFIPYLIQGPTD